MIKNVIRDLDTRLFLGRNDWVKDGRLAQHFADDKSALQAVDQYAIENAEIVSVNERGKVTSGHVLRMSEVTENGA